MGHLFLIIIIIIWPIYGGIYILVMQAVPCRLSHILDNSKDVDVGAIQYLSIGWDVTEGVVVIWGADGHMGQCCELCIVPAIVET